MSCDRCRNPAVTRLKLVSQTTNQPILTEVLCEEHRQMESTLELNQMSIAKHQWSPLP